MVVMLVLVTGPAFAAQGAGHGDGVASVVLSLALILVAAKVGGELAIRVGQPSVLGELLVGVVLGNLGLVGYHGVDTLATDPALDLLAGIGVMLLLFEVGLESTVGQMRAVGPSALLVAVVGVATPFALGWGVGAGLLPGASPYTHAFLGATLTATSVGITARVLKNLGRSQTGEARVILDAAVVDDVLGLVILAVVSGLIGSANSGAAMSYADIAAIVAKAAVFLLGSTLIGTRLSPRFFGWASKLHARGVLLAAGLAFCFFLSWVAAWIGLAPIVGAFAAGLILERVHYRDFTDRGEHGLEELVHPISSFLVPVFFVLMGVRTNLRTFLEPGVAVLALALIVAAVLGKQACSLGVVTKGVDRVTVGVGMVPRGEVGLIFANIGLSLEINGTHIIDQSAFSALVMMVIFTTLVTPPALKWTLGRMRTAAPDVGGSVPQRGEP
jgi:Kef-type K+ transport system membrane component KefB